MSEKNYYLAFSNFSGIGPIKFNKLLKHFGGAQAAWNGSIEDLAPIIGKSYAAKFDIFRKEFDIKGYLKRLGKQKIQFVCLNEKEYPLLLKQISNPTIVLYVKGNAKILLRQPTDQNDNHAIAIVGTRHITSYGREITKMFAGSLSD